ncbi:MAG TPA: hypothetical protein VLI92_02860 [Candidatus Saccharimonadales bacterium]|nr:hypothetical protein [Candidatus Saccharimonadales bacterium]
MSLRKVATVIAIVLFCVYLLWWLWLDLTLPPDSSMHHLYSYSYGILAGYGGVLGFIIANKYGGFKSAVGKSLIFFSFGLFCQFLGQYTYAAQSWVFHIENAYPSWGEIFFFASVPSYILGVWYIGKAAGSGVSLKLLKFKLISIIFPLIMVAVSYYFFINGQSMDGQSQIAIFLNFFYPIGEAAFVSLAILAYLLSSNVLGGVMKRRVIFILFSLVFQYVADSLFLYRTIQGTWYQADFSEFMFAMSYALMTLAFLDFSSVFGELKDKN